MNIFSLLVVAAGVAAASAAGIRGEMRQRFSKEEAVEGYPSAGVPILPDHLDFADGVQDSDFVIDVTGRVPNQGGAGTVQARESPNTPALQGQGIALSLFTIEEGGQNLIHYHPRATELLYVIAGTILVGFTTTEGRYIENQINAGQATVFPRALLHFQRNIGTGTTQYISILNDENPGVMSFPRVLATMPTDIISQNIRVPENITRVGQAVLTPPQLVEGGVNPNYDGAAGPNGNAPVPAVANQTAPIPNPVEGGPITIGESIPMLRGDKNETKTNSPDLSGVYEGLLSYIQSKEV